MIRLLVVLAVLGALASVRPVLAARRGRAERAPLPQADLSALVAPDAARTWVVFTTPYCVSCGPVRAELERTFPDDAVVTIDAAERPDLTDRLGVRRSPTVFELDAEGAIVDRHIGPEQARSRMGLVEAR